MIHCVISAVATVGKEDAAGRWALKVAKYFNEAYGKYGHIEVAQSLDGVSRTHWIEKLKSLTALDQAKAAWSADAKANSLGVEGSGLFGPTETHFYEVVEE